MANRKSGFVSDVRQVAAKFVQVREELKGLNDELTANGGGAWLTAEAFEDDNADLNAGNVTDLVSTTQGALETFMATHATNIYKVHP